MAEWLTRVDLDGLPNWYWVAYAMIVPALYAVAGFVWLITRK
jgi:hypothetical protein